MAAGLTVLDVAPSRREIERHIASLSAGRFRRPVLVLGIDGAYVPTRPDSARVPQEGRRHTRAKRARWRGQWRDAKGFRFYLLDGERIVHVLSWHQVQNDEQLGEVLKQIKEAGLIPEEQVRLCVICDGAEWIWNPSRPCFPRRVRCSITTTVRGLDHRIGHFASMRPQRIERIPPREVETRGRLCHPSPCL